MSKNNPDRNLLESIAHIAYQCGHAEMYGGNFVQDIDNIVEWAIEFETIYKNTDWGITIDYLETIEEFTSIKIKQYKI